MRKVLLAAGAALVLLAAGSQAQALVFYTAFTGHFMNGNDNRGLFGAVGDPLAGLEFRAVFRTDSDIPGFLGITGSFMAGDGYVALGGGGAASKTLGPPFWEIDYFAGSAPDAAPPFTATTVHLNAHSLLTDFIGGTTDLSAVFDYVLVPGPDLGGGNFLSSQFNGQGPTVDTFGLMSVDRVTVAIPEPGAWALMILGFAGTGAALRRRRELALA